MNGSKATLWCVIEQSFEGERKKYKLMSRSFLFFFYQHYTFKIAMLYWDTLNIQCISALLFKFNSLYIKFADLIFRIDYYEITLTFFWMMKHYKIHTVTFSVYETNACWMTPIIVLSNSHMRMNARVLYFS